MSTQPIPRLVPSPRVHVDIQLPPCIRRAVRAGVLRRRHIRPFPGRILVARGDRVSIGQIWCRGRLRTGVEIVDLPRLLRVPPTEVRRLIAVTLGATVDTGTLLAGNPGRMRTGTQWVAPARGTLADVSPRTGVAVFMNEVREVALYCRLGGVVTDVDTADGIVVEGAGVSVAGAVGAGGRAYGPLHVVESGNRPEPCHEGPTGAVLVTPDPLRAAWVERAVEVGAAGVIAPAVDDEALSDLALVPTLAGLVPPLDAPQSPPIPIVLTEGVGYRRMPRALQTVFRSAVGSVVAIVASRLPGESEILLPPGPSEQAVEGLRANGLPVRIVAGPDAGSDGELVGLAPDVGRAPSGAPAESVRVRRTEGGAVAVPLANLEALA